MRLQFDEGERQSMTARLGLSEDASDEDLAAAVAAWMDEDPPSGHEEEEDPNASTDDLDGDQDVVVVDVASYRRLQDRDRMAGQIEAANLLRDRNELVEEAIADGKIAPSRREHYRNRYDSDQEGTIKLLARLAKNTVPLEARGVDTSEEEADSTSYPREWVPELAAQQQQGGQPRNRVHSD
jgi:hypothetical protein